MSLLMDALKRAEEAKRQQSLAAGGIAETPAPDASAELSLEPVGASSGLPDLNSHLESVDADLKATAAENARESHRSPAYATTAAAIAAQRNTAQAVFAAKQEADAPAGTMKRFLVIGAFGLVLAAGVGGYFYWQLQTISGAGSRLAARPGTPMPTRPVAVPAPLPQIATASPAPAPEIVAAPPKPATAAPVATTPPQATVPAPATTLKASPRPERAPKLAAADAPTRKRAATTLPEPPVQAPADGGLRISTHSQDSAVQRAFDDLQAGRLDAARAGYQQALRADPRNGDALVGLATIAQREGDPAAAERFYQQAITADPRNASAHAGLISLRGEADAPASESRLKTLIAQQGSDPAASGTLNFASATSMPASAAGTRRSRPFSRRIRPTPNTRTTCTTWR